MCRYTISEDFKIPFRLEYLYECRLGVKVTTRFMGLEKGLRKLYTLSRNNWRTVKIHTAPTVKRHVRLKYAFTSQIPRTLFYVKWKFIAASLSLSTFWPLFLRNIAATLLLLPPLSSLYPRNSSWCFNSSQWITVVYWN